MSRFDDLKQDTLVERVIGASARNKFLIVIFTVFAVAAKEAGLEAIVNMSQISARADHPSPASRQHWLAERILDWTGIGTTHLRPPFFLEDLLVFADVVKN